MNPNHSSYVPSWAARSYRPTGWTTDLLRPTASFIPSLQPPASASHGYPTPYHVSTQNPPSYDSSSHQSFTSPWSSPNHLRRPPTASCFSPGPSHLQGRRPTQSGGIPLHSLNSRLNDDSVSISHTHPGASASTHGPPPGKVYYDRYSYSTPSNMTFSRPLPHRRRRSDRFGYDYEDNEEGNQNNPFNQSIPDTGYTAPPLPPRTTNGTSNAGNLSTNGNANGNVNANGSINDGFCCCFDGCCDCNDCCGGGGDPC